MLCVSNKTELSRRSKNAQSERTTWYKLVTTGGKSKNNYGGVCSSSVVVQVIAWPGAKSVFESLLTRHIAPHSGQTPFTTIVYTHARLFYIYVYMYVRYVQHVCVKTNGRVCLWKAVANMRVHIYIHVIAFKRKLQERGTKQLLAVPRDSACSVSKNITRLGRNSAHSYNTSTRNSTRLNLCVCMCVHICRQNFA